MLPLFSSDNDDASNESGHERSTDSDAALDMDGTGPKWLLFEKMIASAEADLDSSAKVTHNDFLLGSKSRSPRQIDILARGSIVRREMLVVIECKRYKNRLGIGKVDEFIGKLVDIGASHGILYGYSGVTAPAQARADGASNPTVEIRDFLETLKALEDAAQGADSKQSNRLTYEELSQQIAQSYGEQLARIVAKHLTFNCAVGIGCRGVVEIDVYDDETSHGTCSDCHALHFVCDCDQQLVAVIDPTHSQQECWCGAKYDLSLSPDADVRSLRLNRHGEDCDGVHNAP